LTTYEKKNEQNNGQNPLRLSLAAIVGGAYNDFWNFKGRYRIVKGSRASKKSKTAALWFIYNLTKYTNANLLVVRKTFETLKDSCYNELKWAAETLGVSANWKFTVSPLEITNVHTGQKIYFRGLDKPFKVTSITVSKGALCFGWIEEAYEIEKEEDFKILDGSLPRGTMTDDLFVQWTFTFNPWVATHWLKKRFFDAPDKNGTKFCNTLAMTTNYTMNEFINQETKDFFDDLAVKDPEYAQVACFGEWGMPGETVFCKQSVMQRLKLNIQPIKTGYYIYDENSAGIFNTNWTDGDEYSQIRIYREPENLRPYVIGADTAGEGSDWFAAHVIDNVTGEQCAVIHCKYDSDLFVRQLYCLGIYYNNALIAIEKNFSEHAVKELERIGYGNQFVTPQEDVYTGSLKKSFGFNTTHKSRNTVIAELIRIVREKCELVNDVKTLEEMLTFVRNEKGRPEAKNGTHDDLIMSLAIAYAPEVRSQQSRTAGTPDKERVYSHWSRSMYEDYQKESKSEKAKLLDIWGYPENYRW
jgi:phage terminase large subunit